jgi:hypothetical protein
MKHYLCIISVCGMLIYGPALAAQPGWQGGPIPDSWQQLLDGCQVQADDLVYCSELQSRYRANTGRVQVPLAWLDADRAIALELGIRWHPQPVIPYSHDYAGQAYRDSQYSYFGLSTPSGAEIRLGLDSAGAIPWQPQQPALLLQLSNPW